MNECPRRPSSKPTSIHTPTTAFQQQRWCSGIPPGRQHGLVGIGSVATEAPLDRSLLAELFTTKQSTTAKVSCHGRTYCRICLSLLEGGIVGNWHRIRGMT